MNDGYFLRSDGYFVIENYNDKKPFSNFLPGIAGLLGTPMWVFYVNRGQGIASFGIRNKDQAILEFFPANKAYQQTARLGFRTFIKRGGHGYEPFQAVSSHKADRISQSLEIASHDFLVQETNRDLGLNFLARYFTVPHEPIAALARELTITNLSKVPCELEVLDGIPVVQPFGMNEFLVKQMSRTIEAWMTVDNLKENTPYFHLKVDPTDRPELEEIRGGNFYFSTSGQASPKASLQNICVDPQIIFGSVTDFSFPKAFFETEAFRFNDQVSDNRTPCAFSFSKVHLRPGQSKSIFSYCGHAESIEHLNRYAQKACRGDYFQKIKNENQTLIEQIKSRAFTVSRSQAFDQYCGQTFLDNVLRGGLPVAIGPKKDPLIFYAYSRKHGDLERDYNRFFVEPGYFSQGDGNYRDVNQNRRNDAWFNPDVRGVNIRTFLDLIQLDGGNPLITKGVCFHFKKSAESLKVLRERLGAKRAMQFLDWTSKKAFTLGQLCLFLEEKMAYGADLFRFLSDVSSYLDAEQTAEHGEGYWSDHWTYNLDLIESYLAIYPDRLKSLLFNEKIYTYFDNDHVLRPRGEKYFLKNESNVRQYKSVARETYKSALIAKRLTRAYLARTQNGRGEIFTSTLFVKLLFLAINKFMALDPNGVGIEMESDKPGWLDALNGLPGLLGSSVCESFELKRLILFVLQSIEDLELPGETPVLLPLELSLLIEKLDSLAKTYFKSSKTSKDFVYWDRVSSVKEAYRQAVKSGISGKEKKVALSRIKLFLEHAREKIEIGLGKAYDPKTRLFPTYFENEVMRYKVTSRTSAGTRVKALAFRQKPLPIFLEANVHALKVEKDPAARRNLVKAVRESALFDRKLHMYKLNVPLEQTSMEIGRAKVFKPGWLENESVWLHMEYKFLLELLRSGLTEEFYQDFQKALIPFQDPARYGRSILENSSFIVSSAFFDPALHGAGFVARLSGSTAEFLHIWLLMNVGKRPFSLGPDGKLALRLDPSLPSFLFTSSNTERAMTGDDGSVKKINIEKNSYAFLFLGKTLVVYHNPRKLDTFGNVRVSVKKIILTLSNSKSIEFKGDTIPSPYSLKVRDEFVPRIDIELS